MSPEIRDRLDAYLREALELRFAGEHPNPGAGPAAVLASLLDVRVRLDRVEELLVQTLRIRARARSAADHAEAVAADAWDRSVDGARSAPVVRGDEYSSAKERYAAANLAVLDLRIAGRSAQDLAGACESAVDVLRLTHRGLEGVRHDYLAIIRSQQFESTLDR